MKIHVSRVDIVSGTCCSALHCPIANAIRRAFFERKPEVEAEIHVSDGVVLIGLRRVRLPRECIDFILAFDTGNSVEPFEFELDYEVAA